MDFLRSARNRGLMLPDLGPVSPYKSTSAGVPESYVDNVLYCDDVQSRRISDYGEREVMSIAAGVGESEGITQSVGVGWQFVGEFRLHVNRKVKAETVVNLDQDWSG